MLNMAGWTGGPFYTFMAIRVPAWKPGFWPSRPGRLAGCQATFYPSEGHISVIVNRAREILESLAVLP